MVVVDRDRLCLQSPAQSTIIDESPCQLCLLQPLSKVHTSRDHGQNDVHSARADIQHSAVAHATACSMCGRFVTACRELHQALRIEHQACFTCCLACGCKHHLEMSLSTSRPRCRLLALVPRATSTAARPAAASEPNSCRRCRGPPWMTKRPPLLRFSLYSTRSPTL